MPNVESISRTMIERYVRPKGVSYRLDANGDAVLDLPPDAECRCQLHVRCMLSGPQRNILCVRVLSGKSIPQRDWGKGILLCNRWNCDKRWPKAFLHYERPESSDGEIVLEGHLDLERGIHQELFNDFVDGIVATAFDFWEWAHRERGFA